MAIPTALYHGNIELARIFLSRNTDTGKGREKEEGKFTGRNSKNKKTTSNTKGIYLMKFQRDAHYAFEGSDNRFHSEALSDKVQRIVYLVTRLPNIFGDKYNFNETIVNMFNCYFSLTQLWTHGNLSEMKVYERNCATTT